MLCLVVEKLWQLYQLLFERNQLEQLLQTRPCLQVRDLDRKSDLLLRKLGMLRIVMLRMAVWVWWWGRMEVTGIPKCEAEG